MNHQTFLESKRILAIVEDLLDDLTILQHVPAYLSQLSPTDLHYLGPDVQHRISEQFDLERKIELGHGQVSEEISFAHKHSVRATVDLLRMLGFTKSYDPHTMSDESMARYLMVIKILRGLMIDKFNTTVEEDLLKFEILRDTVSREQTASADVKALNREFQSERSLRKVEVQKRDQAIAKLSEELQSIQDNAIEDAKDFERQIKDQEQIAIQTYQKEEEDLVTAVNNLETALTKAEETNSKEEAGLRQERRKREQFLDGLLTQYDSEMTKKTKDLEDLIKEYKKDQVRLEDLEKDLKIFDEEQAKRDEEERIENERKLHHMDILVRMETSAKIAQAFWRGYAVRLMMKKKKAGKKKKKKKG